MTTEHDHHGHSPAAWVAVTVMIAAFVSGTVFFWLENALGVWVSVGFVFVGWALGGILARLGWGVNGPKYQPKGR